MTNEEMEARLRARMEDTYRAVLAECLAGLQLAIDVKDLEHASFWAHKLIPSSMFQGHVELSAACKDVDQAVDEGATWVQVEPMVHEAIKHAQAVPSRTPP